MEKHTIIYKGKPLEIEQLPNGKFRKPDISQFTHQGLGSVWLDDGRIPYESEGEWQQHIRKDHDHGNSSDQYQYTDHKKGKPVSQGRFAPNLLVSDDVLNDGRVTKSNSTPRPRGGTYFRYVNESDGRYYPADSGSYSRYFSLDAWAEKNLPDSVKRTFPFMIVPKASKSEKNAGLDELEEKVVECLQGNKDGSINKRTNGKPSRAKNHHSTVKPIKLMSYLITIGSRPGDVILDPFVGSGTTAVAAAILDRRYIGIELDAEMVDISERRIKWHVKQAEKEANAQLKLDLTAEGGGE